MRHRPSTLLLCLVFAVLLTAGFAAKKDKGAAADAPPQLISTKGARPKWKTVEQLEQFAAKGDPQACFELAERSQDGMGVPQDLVRAIALFEQAAKGGVADGWFRLGKIYHDGLAETPDYGRALECYTRAARAGIVEAQHNIGAMLVSARGVKRDYVEGLAWLLVAGKSGDDSGAEAQVRQRLAQRPADIAAAETRATEIASNLPTVAVRATLLGKSPPAMPKPEPVVPPKIIVPMTPTPVITPGKP